MAASLSYRVATHAEMIRCPEFGLEPLKNQCFGFHALALTGLIGQQIGSPGISTGVVNHLLT
jgi:hypothetical protein